MKKTRSKASVVRIGAGVFALSVLSVAWLTGAGVQAATCGECKIGVLYTFYNFGCRVTNGGTGYVTCCPAVGWSDVSSITGDNKCDDSDPDKSCANDKAFQVPRVRYTVTSNSCKNPCPPTDPGTCGYDTDNVGDGFFTKTNQCSTDMVLDVRCVPKTLCYGS